MAGYMIKLVKLNERTYVSPNNILMVCLNGQTLKTAVFLTVGGVAVESDFTFDETVKLVNGEA